MRKGGGKQKGSENERTVCKVLSKWWTGKDKPIVFWRVGSSGAQFTLSGGATDMSGDVVSTHPDGSDFPFSVETKSVKSVDFSDLLFPGKKTNQIEAWWGQCKSDAMRASKIPLLLFRKNGMRKDSYFFMIEKDAFKNVGFYTFPHIISNGRIVGLLDDLIQTVTKSQVMESIQKIRK